MYRSILILLMLVVAPATVFCADYRADYVYGTVEVQAGKSWQAVEIGRIFSEDALLRVGPGSVAELSCGSVRITLSEAGTYRLADLVRGSSQVASWGIVQMVRGKIRNLFRGQPEIESTAMGVRAEKIEDDLGFDWMDEEEEAVSEGKSLLQAERYDEAVDYFLEALELADEPNRSVYLFYIGYAYAMVAKSGLAMRYLNEADPSRLGSHYGDFVVLRGELLIEGQAYTAALELFAPFLEAYPNHENAQVVNVLSAFCSNELGQKAAAQQSLQKAYALDPNSDTGRKARSMLDSL